MSTPDMQGISNDIAYMGLFVSFGFSFFLFLIWLIVKEVNPPEANYVFRLFVFSIIMGIVFLMFGAYVVLVILIFVILVLLLTAISIISPIKHS